MWHAPFTLLRMFPQEQFFAHEVISSSGALSPKRVLIGSSNYFAAGPNRSTISFHEATILAFVFRAL